MAMSMYMHQVPIDIIKWIMNSESLSPTLVSSTFIKAMSTNISILITEQKIERLKKITKEWTYSVVLNKDCGLKSQLILPFVIITKGKGI